MAIFVAVHMVLALGSYVGSNTEESEYGNLAIAMLDGMVWETGDFQQLDRQGMVRLRAPLTALLFAVMGPNRLALKLSTILFAALTAALAYALARRLAPTAPRLETGLLCAVPAPLVQAAALHPYSPAGPFGALLFFLGAMLLLDRITGTGRRDWVLLVAAGGVAGLGIWAGTAFVSLLPAVAWVAWRARGAAGVAVLSAATLPGWSAVVANLRVGLDQGAGADSLFGLAGITGFLPPGVGIPALTPLLRSFAYWPGVGTVKVGGFGPDYLPAGLLLTPVVLLLGVAWFRRRPQGGPGAWGAEGVVAGAACWAFALSVSGYEVLAGAWRIDPNLMDGLRYCWPWPTMLVLVAILGAPHLRGGRWLLRLMAAVFVIGLAIQITPSRLPTPWGDLAGYQTILVRTRTRPPALTPDIDPSRLPHYTLWVCQELARTNTPRTRATMLERATALGVPPNVRDACWRGVGMTFSRGMCADRPGACIPADVDPEMRQALWEGIGMGRACDDLAPALAEAGAEYADAVWWGAGRVEAQCIGSWLHRRRDVPPAYDAGWIQGWERDVLAPGTPLDRGTMERVILHGFEMQQGPSFEP